MNKKIKNCVLCGREDVFLEDKCFWCFENSDSNREYNVRACSVCKEEFYIEKSVDNGSNICSFCYNAHKNKSHEISKGHIKTCKKCEKENLHTNGRNICTTCYNTAQNNKNKKKTDTSIESYIKRILREIPRRKKECDLTLDQLLELYTNQKGLCAITGLRLEIGNKKLEHGGQNPLSISLDRIDNKKGYTIENVWFICLSVNTFKSVHELKDVFYIAKKICENNSISVDQVF